MYYLLMIFSVLISVLSQVMLKLSANKLHKNVFCEYMNPYVIGAYCVFVVASFCSVLAYKGLPLSVGVALESTSYIFIVIIDVLLFHEKINTAKMISMLLIIIGVLMVSGLGGFV